MLTYNVDMSRMNQQITALRDALIGSGQMGDAATIIEDESRKFLKQVIAFTPPPGNSAAAQKQGEGAIRNDMLKIFTPVNEGFLDMVGSQFGTTGIDTWLTHPDTGKHYELRWDKLDPTGSGMESFHRANQNRRGRTKNLKRKAARGVWASPYVVAWRDFQARLQKLQHRVGWRKAAWGKSFVALGGKLPKWISRHIGSHPSECLVQLTGTSPSVTMIARAPGLLDDQRIVRDAMRSRQEAISRRIKLILSGYAKDVKAGMIINRKEHRNQSDSL